MRWLKRTVLALTAVAVLAAVRHFTAGRVYGGPLAIPPAVDEVWRDIPVSAPPTRADRLIAAAVDRLRARPTDPDALCEVGDALMQKARDTGDPTCYSHAERVYRRAVQVAPGNGRSMVGLAWVCGARHQFEESAEWARRALAADPRAYDAHGLLGDAALEMGRREEALDHYQRMIDARPDLASYSRGAHVLFVTGDVRGAVELMGRAIRAGAPYGENTAWCRAQLATMLLKVGAVLPAEKVLEAGLKAAPDDPRLLAAMGRARLARGDDAGALSCLQRAADASPQHETLVMLQEVHERAGRRAEARAQQAQIEARHRLLRGAGVHGDTAIARYYADRGVNLPEALRMAEAECRTRRNPYALDALAWCQLRAGKPEAARATIDEALAWRTPDAAMHYHAGVIYAALGDRPTARRRLYEALSLEPTFSVRDAHAARQMLSDLAERAAHGARPTRP